MGGGSETSLIKVYKALILSLINYGSVIYNSAKLYYILSTFDPFHNQSIRLASL